MSTDTDALRAALARLTSDAEKVIGFKRKHGLDRVHVRRDDLRALLDTRATPAPIASGEVRKLIAEWDAAIGGVTTNEGVARIEGVGNAMCNLLSRAQQSGVEAEREAWRDIATAPKDGSEVLIYGGTARDDASLGGPYPFNRASIAHWTGDDWGEDHPWEGNPDHSHDDYRRHAPTHWQPLPAAPARATQEDTANG